MWAPDSKAGACIHLPITTYEATNHVPTAGLRLFNCAGLFRDMRVQPARMRSVPVPGRAMHLRCGVDASEVFTKRRTQVRPVALTSVHSAGVPARVPASFSVQDVT